MSFSFTMFEPKKDRAAKKTEPLVQIRPNGRIVFNKPASELLGSNNFCMLGFDPTSQAVGIMPLAERKINAFPIRYAAKGAYVGAKKFFRFYDILPAQAVENKPVPDGQFIGVPL